jgi:hypothetical protein
MLPLEDPEENQRQEELLIEWQRKGYARTLGLWISDPLFIDRYRLRNPFKFAIRPFNVTTSDAASIFAACKRSGWETLATSPLAASLGDTTYESVFCNVRNTWVELGG